MPNGAQTPTEEEEGSGGESQEEWDSDAVDDDEGDDSGEEEEEDGESDEYENVKSSSESEGEGGEEEEEVIVRMRMVSWCPKQHYSDDLQVLLETKSKGQCAHAKVAGSKVGSALSHQLRMARAELELRAATAVILSCQIVSCTIDS